MKYNYGMVRIVSDISDKTNKTLESLAESCGRYLDAGWIPHGPTDIKITNVQIIYHQAFILKRD